MGESRNQPPGPRPIDAAALAERLKGRAAAALQADQEFVARAGIVQTGRLVRHGEANYEFRDDASPSYFVELQTGNQLQVLWGVDLKRAIAESFSQVKDGDMVGVQRVGYDVITPRGTQPGADRRRRTRWRVEGVTQFAEMLRDARRDREAALQQRAEVRQRPELRAAYVSVAVAREYAARHIRDPEDRERFLARLQEVMAASAAQSRRGPESAGRPRDPDAPAR